MRVMLGVGFQPVGNAPEQRVYDRASIESAPALDLLRHHLQQWCRRNGELANERPVMSGDQNRESGDARREQAHADYGCKPAIAVNHGDGDERTNGLYK